MFRFQLAFLAALLAGCAGGPRPEMQPFEVDWRDNGGSPVDVSFLLEAPAGDGGHITVRDGRLVNPNGERIRLWGVNTSFAANAPARENAPIVADHLARHGINCVRVHHFDRHAPRGLFDATTGDTRHFDAEMLDRFDFWVAELKKRGIYINLNLNVSRQFQEGDGVKDADKIGYGKGLTYFDPRLIELQREYAEKLLTHRNPYTGNEYRHEPAVAIVEMVNENSIIESWVRGRLEGEQTEPSTTTWSDIPPSYEQDLTELYNEWLGRKLPAAERAKLRAEAGVADGEAVPRLLPEQFAEASKFRFHIETGFYMDLEERFFEMMREYLQDELGVMSLLVGTSVHGSGLTGYPLQRSMTKLDVFDGHTYWQHPRYSQDPETGQRISTLRNTAMVDDPFHSTVMALSRNAVAGKPYTASEINHPYPAEHAAEGLPILAAYGALHDWDGIFWYSYAHPAPADWKPGPPGHFDIRQDPVKMSQLAVGALLFLRGDVGVAKETVTRSYTLDQVVETIRMDRSEAPYFTPGFPMTAPLEHGTRTASFHGPETESFEGSAANPVVSDTGELTWYLPEVNDGLITIDTPRSQGIVGHVNARPAETKNLALDVANDFCVVTVHSLDDMPIAEASRLLLTTGAKVATTGMVWNEERTRVLDQGAAPVTIETVAGEVTLKGLGAPTAMRLPSTAAEVAKPPPEEPGGATSMAVSVHTPSKFS